MTPTIDREAEARAALAGYAFHDFAWYLKAVATDEFGRPLPLDGYVRMMASTLTHCAAKGMHVGHVSPPGLGKSTIARHFMLWRIGRENTLRTVVIGGDETAAQDAVTLCRQVLLSKPYRNVFVEAVPDYEASAVKGAAKGNQPPRDDRGWRADGWFLRTAGQRKDPTMSAVALVPKREDMRVDILLADDIVTERIANSTAEATRVTRTFYNTWLEGRLSNGGWCMYLQNLRRRDDLAHALRNDSRFCSVWVGVEEDCSALFVRVWNPPDDLPLLVSPESFGASPISPRDNASAEFAMPLPVRGKSWTPEGIQAREARARRLLYHLHAANPEDVMLPHWHARHLRDATGAQLVGLPSDHRGLPMAGAPTRMASLAIAAGLDLSGGERDGTVLTIGARLPAGIIVPIETARGRWNILQLIDRIDDAWQRGLKWGVLHVENNAVQDQIVEAIRLHAQSRNLGWAHTITPWTTGRNKLDPSTGLPALDVMIENGAILWPDAEARSGKQAEAWRRLEGDLESCPRFPRAGETPDGIMSFWFMVQALERVRPPMEMHAPKGLSGQERSQRYAF